MGDIIVVGSGIVGLYTAFVLAENGYGHSVNVVAAELPGDDAGSSFVSPLAGAHWASRAVLDLGGDLEVSLDRQKRTYLFLKELAAKFGPVCGVKPTKETELWAGGPPPELNQLLGSLESYIRDLVVMDAAQLAGRAKFGITYTGYNVNPDVMLSFLMNYLKTQGVTFKKQPLTKLPSAKIVFNCAGLGASSLANDPSNFPVRGQVVLVRAPHITENLGLAAPNGLPPTYIIARPYSGGVVVLGGYRDANNWSMEPQEADRGSIIDRCTKLCPDLLRRGPLTIIGEHVGLRPYRKGGPRVELARSGGSTVVHCYGAGGVGYQLGYALAEDAVKLIGPIPKL